MQILCKSLIFSAILILPLISYGATSSLQVTTGTGVVEGKQDGPVRTFLGIPYAAPPVGDLRWKPPIAADKWTGVRKATAFGAACVQPPVYDDMNFRGASQSEDCLYLNVWTPAKAADAKLAVMVWIHGGGFVAGASSEPRQDGTFLSQQNVVVVSMNYRLGIFGFFVHPDLAKESGRNAAGNYGLLDMIAALQWVRDNVAAFGGDPGNVTIFGESAGSFAVSDLMASPLAKGLFHKAIGESGGAFSNTGLALETLAAREEKDLKFAASAYGVQTIAQLRAIPAQDAVKQTWKRGGEDNIGFDPVVDGYFLPDTAAAIFAAGKQNDVPLLAGWNHDEGGLDADQTKPAVESFKAVAKKDFGEKAADFLKLYPANNDAQALRSTEDYRGDRFIAWGTWMWIEAQSATGKQPVYRYRFDLALPVDPKGEDHGAYHSAEIEYVFGQLDSKPHMDWRASDRQLSAEMQKYWSNFARSGDPNGSGLANWPPYSPAGGWQVMFLNEKSEARKDDLRGRYLFLREAWK
jgi:para-nitrobenzyl esterase